jgi:acyl-CoA synthetase (AMP-forming)/AMP-acid ligase II
MAGYLGRTDETESTVVDGWLHTGDIGYLDEDGYLYLTGRAKDLIIRGGENIAPTEIEAILEQHPAVEEAVVIGAPSEEWGEQVEAVVVLRRGRAVSAEELREYCRSRLASFKVPEYIDFVADLPRNSLGKVLKAELRKE